MKAAKNKKTLKTAAAKCLLLWAVLTAPQFFITACSSAPKRSMLVTSVQESAASYLEAANSFILTGNYTKAEEALNSAFNCAMSVDNATQLTSICLAKVSLKLSYNPPLIDEAEIFADMAAGYAKYSDNATKYQALTALSEVRIAAAKNQGTTQELINKLNKNTAAVKGDTYSEAQFKSVAGDVYRLKKDYASAEASYREAADIFTKNRYLSEIGITWYKIAQVCSLNSKKAQACTAIEQAIFYDRCAENSAALGADYYAKAIILMKGSITDSQKQEALYSLEHSADIFKSVKMDDAAEKSLAKLKEFQN